MTEGLKNDAVETERGKTPDWESVPLRLDFSRVFVNARVNYGTRPSMDGQ